MSKVRENKEKVVLSYTLPPILVEVEKGTDAEMLERGKRALIEKLKEGIPKSTKINLEQLGALSFETVKPGMIVEILDAGVHKFGIVTKVNRKTINVVTRTGVVFQGPPSGFKESSIPFEEVCCVRKKTEYSSGYQEGDAGFLNVNGGDFELVPVVLQPSGQKYKAYIVTKNKLGRFYTLTKLQLDTLFTQEGLV